MTATAEAPNRDRLEQMVISADCSDDVHRRSLGTGALREVEVRQAFGTVVGDNATSPAFDRLIHDRAEELRRFREDSKSRAGALASEASTRLASLMGARRGLIDDAAPDPDGVAPWVPETTPVLFIRSSSGATLRDSQIADGDTWAKWEAAASGDAIRHVGEERVSFYHVWQNPTRRQALVDVIVGLAVRGHISSEADGMGFPAGLFWDVSRSDVNVGARLTIWPLWLPGVADRRDDVALDGISAGGAVFGDASSAAIATGTELRTLRYPVPREAYIMIEASVTAEFSCLSGNAEADFASKDSFRIDDSYCFVLPPP